MFLFLIDFIQRELGEGSFSVNSSAIWTQKSHQKSVAVQQLVSSFWIKSRSCATNKQTNKTDWSSYPTFSLWFKYPTSCSHDFLSIYHIYMLWVQKFLSVSLPLIKYANLFLLVLLCPENACSSDLHMTGYFWSFFP